MAKHGTDLGADLYQLWDAGTNMFPTVAGDYDVAWDYVPGSIQYTCARSGPLGAGAYGPGPNIDSIITQLNDAISTTGKNLREVGRALVWVAPGSAGPLRLSVEVTLEADNVTGHSTAPDTRTVRLSHVVPLAL